MTKRIIPAVLASVLLMGGAARLGAQSQPRNRQVEQMISERDVSERIFFLNQANKIYADDAARKQAMYVSLKASTYDVNHDGKLDTKERAAWEKRLRTVLGKTPEFMKQYDVDQDKILSDTEWDTAYLAIFEPKESAPSGSSGA